MAKGTLTKHQIQHHQPAVFSTHAQCNGGCKAVNGTLYLPKKVGKLLLLHHPLLLPLNRLPSLCIVLQVLLPFLEHGGKDVDKEAMRCVRALGASIGPDSEVASSLAAQGLALTLKAVAGEGDASLQMVIPGVAALAPKLMEVCGRPPQTPEALRALGCSTLALTRLHRLQGLVLVPDVAQGILQCILATVLQGYCFQCPVEADMVSAWQEVFEYIIALHHQRHPMVCACQGLPELLQKLRQTPQFLSPGAQQLL